MNGYQSILTKVAIATQFQPREKQNTSIKIPYPRGPKNLTSHTYDYHIWNYTHTSTQRRVLPNNLQSQIPIV